MTPRAHTALALPLMIATLLLCACAAPGNRATEEPARETPSRPLVAFLVRHAEKAKVGRDPQLTEAGVARASALATMLRSAGIEHVHSSDTIRTRETARPTAELLRVEIELYDPRDLQTLADTLLAAGGRHLVVGHSNTTPELVALLGGEAGEPIDEPTEFDRLYVVTIDAEGDASTVLLRCGSPFDQATERH